MADENRETVTLRSPSGDKIQVSDPDDIREYENNGYERVDSDDQQ